MQMDDCMIEGTLTAVTAPLTRAEPDPEWLSAKESGIVPLSAFSLYRRANFLSFGSSPRFLSDRDHYLFGYFSMVLESVRGTLVDADDAVSGFAAAQSQTHDIGKEYRGETWDDQAGRSAKNHFRMLVLSLCSTLDAIAELTAVLLTGGIPGLVVGKAEFQRIEDWLRTPLRAKRNKVVTPTRSKLEELHQSLRPIVEAGGSEKDWLPLMRLFRNKAAHLGTESFREVGFHDSERRFYRFFPRHWPVLWEEHLRSKAQLGAGAVNPTLTALRRQFMRQDNISYVQGLRAKVTILTASAFAILDSAYAEFKDFESNESALAQLKGNVKAFAFERFL
jgi:hypothetical protein